MADKPVKVSIDRVNIRLRGVSAPVAQAAVKQLGSCLLQRMARDEAFINGQRKGRIDSLDAGSVNLQGAECKDPVGLRDRIAAGIVNAVVSNATIYRRDE